MKKFKTILKNYSKMRSLSFTAQYWALNRLSDMIGFKTPNRVMSDSVLRAAKKSLDDLIEADVDQICRGSYPASVLRPDLSLEGLSQFPRVVLDGLGVGRRRTAGSIHEFTDSAKKYFDHLPDYYLRNYHYQTDGYLSDVSAGVYDYEVDLLFSGTTDAMRRLIVPPLRSHFSANPGGKGLKILDIGSGTGRSTQFVKLAFPLATIFGVDLSEPYVKAASKKKGTLERVTFFQGNGADLPFKDGEFDVVYSCFLFHELPLDVRRQVIQESCRVLKHGGFFGYVDSIQKGDFPEFDLFLKDFPKYFHEPFYNNYVSHPMETLLSQFPLGSLKSGVGFFSKFGSARKT